MSSLHLHALERHPHTGEPYIRLPPPLDRVIVTPPRRDDISSIVGILNDYPIKRWLDGPPFPYLDVHAEDWVTTTLEHSEVVMQEVRATNEGDPRGPLASVSGCPVGCLRGVQDDGSEEFLGAIEFTRCGFPDLLDREEQERVVSRNEGKKRGDPEIVWCVGGRRLSRSTSRMGARQIRAETIIGNLGSIRVLEKVGFKITHSVRKVKVTSAGEVIDGFHVLLWQLGR